MVLQTLPVSGNPVEIIVIATVSPYFTELDTLLKHRKFFIVCVFIETAMMYIDGTKSTSVTVRNRTDQTIHYESQLL